MRRRRDVVEFFGPQRFVRRPARHDHNGDDEARPETDELAFVIAHEMAHNILAQGSGDSGAMGIFEMLGFGSRDAIRK